MLISEERRVTKGQVRFHTPRIHVYYFPIISSDVMFSDEQRAANSE